MWVKFHNMRGVSELFNTEHMARIFVDSAINKGTQIAMVDGKVVSVTESVEDVLRQIVAS